MPDLIRFQKLDPRAVLPRRATPGSAGMDLCALLEEELVLAPGGRAMVPTGLAAAVPEGYGAFLFARSGLAVKHGVTLSNCVGVVDSDYRGEIRVGLINQSDRPYTLQPGERIAQLVLLPVYCAEAVECDSLDDTERGAGGFGSTGR